MGISVYDRKDRKKKPFGAKWVEGGKRKFLFFEDAAERDDYIKKFNAKVKKVGPAMMSLSASDAVIMAECLKRVGSGSEVLRAVDEYARRTKIDPVAYSDARKEFLDEKLNTGASDDYLRHLRNTTDKFSTDGPVSSVTAADARCWASELSNAPITNLNDINWMVLFWNWLKDRGYARENVFATVPTPKIPETEPEFLSVVEAKALLSTAQAHFPDALAYFAISLFAGLRSSAICRLDGTQHLRFEQHGILITGENAKNSRRQFIDGHEPNLWEWLEWCKENAPAGFELNARLWERRRGQVAVKAKVKMPKNALRHSFCTYHCALYGDAGKTATLLNHRGNVSILYQHYKGNATKAEAQKFFKIRP